MYHKWFPRTSAHFLMHSLIYFSLLRNFDKSIKQIFLFFSYLFSNGEKRELSESILIQNFVIKPSKIKITIVVAHN